MSQVQELVNENRTKLLYLFGGLFIGIILSIGFQMIFFQASNQDTSELEYLSAQIESLSAKHQELSDNYIQLEGELIATEENLEKKISEHLSLSNEHDAVMEELSELREDQIDLQEKYESLEETYQILYMKAKYWEKYVDIKLTKIEIPEKSKVDFWLRTEASEELIGTNNYDLSQIALLLSIKAREYNWQVGLVRVSGNFSDVIDSMVINALNTRDGLVYFDIEKDKTYDYEDYAEIIIGEVYDIGIHKQIMVTDVEVIIPY